MRNLTCRTCKIPFILTDQEEQEYERFAFTPIPECFTCMQMHKLTFRNGRILYRRICDATQQPILSIYAPDAPYTVYEQSYWNSDAWDAMDYGRDIDFSRPFFDQFQDLQRQVPRMSLININPDNSEYCNMCNGNKDTYCSFGGDFNDGVIYSVLGMHNRTCVDVDYSNHNELCHDAFSTYHCYGCRSTVDSKNCSSCAYLSDCTGCKDCILCVNLSNKQYCIENKQLSKDEYKKQKATLLDGSATTHAQNMEKFRALRKKRIVKFTHVLSSENCTGDFIEGSKDCQNVYFCTDSQDVTNAIFATATKDGFNSSFFGHGSELLFQSMAIAGSQQCVGCYAVANSSDVEYCEMIFSCKNLFGCSGLRQKQYCILNKQYTKEEYGRLRGQLISHMKETGEWGEFFPKGIGCFAYNEGTAMEFFPLTKEEALARGFRWAERYDEQSGATQNTAASSLPDSIRQVPDEILNWAIRSENSKRPFRIVKQELTFYRNQEIPLPHHHPEERFIDRFSTYANPPKLYTRTCMRCHKDIETTYSPERPELVYCEECYLKEVY